MKNSEIIMLYWFQGKKNIAKEREESSE